MRRILFMIGQCVVFIAVIGYMLLHVAAVVEWLYRLFTEPVRVLIEVAVMLLIFAIVLFFIKRGD